MARYPTLSYHALIARPKAQACKATQIACKATQTCDLSRFTRRASGGGVECAFEARGASQGGAPLETGYQPRETGYAPPLADCARPPPLPQPLLVPRKSPPSLDHCFATCKARGNLPTQPQLHKRRPRFASFFIHSRANLAHIRQSTPDSGRGFHVQSPPTL